MTVIPRVINFRTVCVFDSDEDGSSTISTMLFSVVGAENLNIHFGFDGFLRHLHSPHPDYHFVSIPPSSSVPPMVPIVRSYDIPSFSSYRVSSTVVASSSLSSTGSSRAPPMGSASSPLDTLSVQTSLSALTTLATVATSRHNGILTRSSPIENGGMPDLGTLSSLSTDSDDDTDEAMTTL